MLASALLLTCKSKLILPKKQDGGKGKEYAFHICKQTIIFKSNVDVVVVVTLEDIVAELIIFFLSQNFNNSNAVKMNK